MIFIIRCKDIVKGVAYCIILFCLHNLLKEIHLLYVQPIEVIFLRLLCADFFFCSFVFKELCEVCSYQKSDCLEGRINVSKPAITFDLAVWFFFAFHLVFLQIFLCWLLLLLPLLSLSLFNCLLIVLIYF